MGFLDGVGGGMHRTPGGLEMVKKFFSSPEGQNMVISYIPTPRGKQFFGTHPIGIADKLNISPE